MAATPKDLLTELRNLTYIDAEGQEQLLKGKPVPASAHGNVLKWADEMYANFDDFVTDFRPGEHLGFLSPVLPTEFSTAFSVGKEPDDTKESRYPHLARVYASFKRLRALEGMLAKGIKPSAGLIGDAEAVLEFIQGYRGVVEDVLTASERDMQKLPPLGKVPLEAQFTRMLQNLDPGSARNRYECDLADIAFLEALANFSLKACKELGVKKGPELP